MAKKLTKQLHRRYFHAMGYYKLSHLNNQAIPDVSERMVKDPRRFTKALADEVEKISAGITEWDLVYLQTIHNFFTTGSRVAIDLHVYLLEFVP